MKTRYSSLVSIKKDAMKKSERGLQEANLALNNASQALELSYITLNNMSMPQSGNISDFLASKTLFSAQRDMIKHNQEWVEYAQGQVEVAQEQLKQDTLEYEKFHYLEVVEIKKIVQEQKVKESKELDEIAVMTYNRNRQEVGK